MANKKFQKGDKVVVTRDGEGDFDKGGVLIIEEENGDNDGSYYAYPVNSTYTNHDYFHDNDTFVIHGSDIELAEAQN